MRAHPPSVARHDAESRAGLSPVVWLPEASTWVVREPSSADARNDVASVRLLGSRCNARRVLVNVTRCPVWVRWRGACGLTGGFRPAIRTPPVSATRYSRRLRRDLQRPGKRQALRRPNSRATRRRPVAVARLPRRAARGLRPAAGGLAHRPSLRDVSAREQSVREPLWIAPQMRLLPSRFAASCPECAAAAQGRPLNRESRAAH